MIDGIKGLRVALKMTQNEFCEKLDIAQSSLSALENKKTKPSLETLSKLKKLAKTKGIKVTYEELLGE